MVRTGGLGRTLGMIIGIALGREREVGPIVEDVKHVDHATEEVHEQPQEAPADDVVNDVESFPSGPHDTSVLTDYVHHVAVTECLELKLSSHRRKVENFGRPALEIEGLVAAT
ncbi:hypothetical protein GmHk_20G059207 [Glycine max]|nr:hypothetical protein GmHk_20G059207 [Glycine max]